MQEFNLQKKYNFLVNRAFIGLLILLPASLPYDRRISAFLSVLLSFVWLLTGHYKKVLSALKSPLVILFVLMFVIPAISLLYSSNKDFSLLEKRISLLLYPLILYTSIIDRHTVRRIVRGFAISCTVASVYTLAMTIYKHEPLDTEMAVNHIGVTHVYMGLFISLAVVFLGYFLAIKEKHDYVSVFDLGQILFLLFFMIVLGGKMSIISLILLSLIVCIILIINAKRWIIGLVFLVLPIAVFVITIKNIDISKSRFAFMLDPQNYFVGDNAWNSIGVRVSILKCSHEVYKVIPVFIGTGVGDVQLDLDKCYLDSAFPSIKSMNPHNQYIQILLGTGIIGLFVFLAGLLYSCRVAHREGNRLYLCFVFLFALCCLTESLLERQQGVMVFAFFNALLIFHFGRQGRIK